MQDVDLAIAADGEATLPGIIEAVKRLADRRSPASLPGARRQAGRREPRSGPSVRAKRQAMQWGGQPGQHRASLRRAVGADQERGLVARLELLQRWRRLAAPPLGFQQAVPLARSRRWRRHWLWRSRLRGWRACEPPARPAVGRDPDRRRPDVRAWGALDGGAPQHPDPERNEQQPLRTTWRSCTCSACATPATEASTAGMLGSELTDPNIDYAKLAQPMGV